jgi:hypothetical protein
MAEFETGKGEVSSFPLDENKARRYAAWFHELDAWTEYWDIYHPETKGHYYFGNEDDEPGLLRQFLPRDKMPRVFTAWKRMALTYQDESEFLKEARVPGVASALLETDELVAALFEKHFGDASDPSVQADYLEAMFHFAADILPPAAERYARIADDDPRKSTAGHHTLDGDIMWFAWSLQLEGAQALATAGDDSGHIRRALLLAGVAMGCPVNFAWRDHRRTRDEYSADAKTRELLFRKAAQWTGDFAAAAREIHALFRIREWGNDE